MVCGNSIEKNIEAVLKRYFPAYLIFREKFLLPLTGAPFNCSWRKDTHPKLEEIGMTSYGVIKSLNFIQHRKNKVKTSDFDQSFKNIYFHFSLIFDCVESLSRSIILLQVELDQVDIKKEIKLSKEELIERYSLWIDKNYDKKFQDLINKGKPIFYHPQNDHTYLSKIVKNPLKRDYNKFIQIIKDYRNFFTHNPGVDVFCPDGREYLVVKKEFFSISNSWADTLDNYMKNNDFFENPKEMIERDFEGLLKLLNRVWIELNVKLEKIYQVDEFDKLIKDYVRK